MKPITLSQWQTKVLKDNKRYIVINSGRRSGKTYLSSIKLLKAATEKENQIIWYIAPTYRQAKSIMWEMLKNLIPASIIKKTHETELEITLINNSRLVLKGGDTPDSLRGVKIDFVVFDEVAFFLRWRDVWDVIRPTLFDSNAKVWFVSTPDGYNHFYELTQIKMSTWSYHHFTTYDNPYIDREEIEKAKKEMDEDSFAQEILGQFRKMSGLIYKTFDRDKHMVKIPDLNAGDWTFTRSLDFGFVHKTALVYFAINSTGTEIYAYDGIYQSDLSLSELAEAVKIKDAGKIITNPVADSAQPLLINELSKRGVYFKPIEKKKDSVKNGITKVAELLKIRNDNGKPTIMFNKDLEWMAYELEHYRWMENKTRGMINEVPLKKDDDFCDALRYFVLNYRKKSDTKILPYKKDKWGIH